MFNDPLSVTFPDPDYSIGEDRYLIIGLSVADKVLVISHTYRHNILRIISAREATYQNEILLNLIRSIDISSGFNHC